MATEGLFKTPKKPKKPELTNRQVAEEFSDALLGVEYGTNFEEQERKREGISLEEYQKREREKQGYKKREVKPLNRKPPGKPEGGFDDEPLVLWFLKNVPEEFLNKRETIKIFEKVLLEKKFQDIWNYKIIPEGLTGKELMNDLVEKMKALGSLCVFDLNLKGIVSSKDKDGVIKTIKAVMEYHKEESLRECPSMGTFHRLPETFRRNVSLYLKRKILIEKLEEILTLDS